MVSFFSDLVNCSLPLAETALIGAMVCVLKVRLIFADRLVS
jgi:hypothetical protein